MTLQFVRGVWLLALAATAGSACAESEPESFAGIGVDTPAGSPSDLAVLRQQDDP